MEAVPKEYPFPKVTPSRKKGLWASLRGRYILSVNVPSQRYLLKPSGKGDYFGTGSWDFVVKEYLLKLSTCADAFGSRKYQDDGPRRCTVMNSFDLTLSDHKPQVNRPHAH